MMRAMLYEAAHIILVRLAKWSWLKAWTMKIARQRGMMKAIVALVRRLAVMAPSSDGPGNKLRQQHETYTGSNRIGGHFELHQAVE